MKYNGKFDSDNKDRNAERRVPNGPQSAAPKSQKKKLPLFVKILLIVLAVVVAAAVGLFIFVTVRYLNLIERPQSPQEDDSVIVLPENEDPESPSDAQQVIKPEELYEDLDDEELAAKQQADAAMEAAESVEPLNVGEDITNYLLIGTDRRGSYGNGNSDSMIVVSLNRKTNKIHLTSLMRAIYVHIPRPSGAYSGMLNWSYQNGGAELLVKTVEENFKIRIDHYCAVDFGSFVSVVDSVGGVPLSITDAEARFINKLIADKGKSVSSGNQWLDGDAALAYSRCRMDNDFFRTGRQRKVIEAIIHQTENLSLTQLDSLATALLPALTTDMSNMEILAEVINVPAYVKYDIDQLMLPIENQDGKSYTGIFFLNGHEMYSMDWEKNLAALEEFINS